jgi:excisionase family DNA binding protein
VNEHPIPLAKAADRYGVRVRQLRGWVRQGKLRAAKPGRELLILATDLERLLTPVRRETRSA